MSNNRGSMGNSRSSICGMMSNNRGSMGNSRSGIGSMGNSRGSNSMSSRVNTSYETMTKPKAMSISKNLGISISFSISNRGSKATTNQRKNNKEFHLDLC